jgi:hypothetical protein
MRTTTARTFAATALVAATLGLTACGGQDVPSAGNPATDVETSQAPAPDSGSSVPTLENGEVDPNVDLGADIAAWTPERVAEEFALLATTPSGEGSILATPDIQTAVASAGAFLSDDYQRALLASDAEPGNYGAWRVLSYDQGADTTGTAEIVSGPTQVNAGAGFVVVDVAVRFTWNYADGTEITNTRSFQLTLVPGTDPDGMPWVLDGDVTQDDVID